MVASVNRCVKWVVLTLSDVPKRQDHDAIVAADVELTHLPK